MWLVGLAGRSQLRLLSLLLIVGSLLGLSWAPKPLSATPAVVPSARLIPHTDVNHLGANFFLDREVEAWKREQTVKMAREAGIGWMMQMFSWEEIEPRRDYYFDDKFKTSTWKKYDDIVDLAERYGLRIIARIDRPPAWARQDNRLPTAPPDNLEDYASFIQTLVARYRGRIHYYQVWNEPNIWPEWGDRPVDPAGYVQMLKLAYTKAKEVDPDVVILSAPLAQTLEESSMNLSELKYLDAMYTAGAKGFFDILSANAYGFDAPPDAPADPSKLNFARLKLLREVMERYGDDDTPVWFHEFGWNASPQDFPPQKLIWRRVSEQQQAEYTAQAIELARSWGWVGVLNVWYFRQVGDIGINRSDYFFRMVDTDFTPRPVYHLVKALGQELRVAGLGVHEETSPAVELEGRWRGRWLDEASGQRVLQSPEKGGGVTFRINGTGLLLSVVAGKGSTRLRVTVGGEDAGLAIEETRAGSLIDLPARETPARATVRAVSGLSPEVHTVRIEHVLGPAWVLDGFEVENKPSAIPFWAFLGAALLGLAGLLASFSHRWQRR